jgi:hypothetical protein
MNEDYERKCCKRPMMNDDSELSTQRCDVQRLSGSNKNSSSSERGRPSKPARLLKSSKERKKRQSGARDTSRNNARKRRGPRLRGGVGRKRR